MNLPLYAYNLRHCLYTLLVDFLDWIGIFERVRLWILTLPFGTRGGLIYSVYIELFGILLFMIYKYFKIKTKFKEKIIQQRRSDINKNIVVLILIHNLNLD